MRERGSCCARRGSLKNWEDWMTTERKGRSARRAVSPLERWLPALVLVTACSVYDASVLKDAVGGHGGKGGATRGGASSGGDATEGGSDAGRGGSSMGGESDASGGTSTTGGSTNGAGGSITGGIGATGGTPSSGGTDTGGNPTGGGAGMTSRGGATSGGGTTATGGATATGGSPATGGAPATGGTLGTGGQPEGGAAGSGGGPGDGSTLFEDDFESGKATRWTPNVAADFSVVTDGTFVYREGTVVNALRVASAGDAAWTDQAVQARVKILAFSATTSASFFSAVFARYVDEDNHYYVALRSDGKLAIRRKLAGSNSSITSAITPATALVVDRWYTIKLEIVGTTLKGYFDGALFATVTDASIAAGKVAVGTVNASSVFDDVVVTDPNP
jgi:hypothetical protein